MTNRNATAGGPGARGARVLLFHYWLPVFGYIALIFSLSSIHNVHIPGPFPFMDKVAHMLEYSLFGLLVGRAIRFTLTGAGRIVVMLAAVSFGSAIGLLDELYQSVVPGRSSDPLDWLTDVVAVAIAVTVTQLLSTRPLGERRGSVERSERL